MDFALCQKIEVQADNNAMVIDPTRDIIVVAAHTENELFAIDPGVPERQIARLSSSGDRPVLSNFASRINRVRGPSGSACLLFRE